MRSFASLALFLFLASFGLLWQTGCNPDLGLNDPLRPQADVQVLSYTPTTVQPSQTGAQLTLPTPSVSLRVNNGVSALVTSYSVVYTFAQPGSPSTGLALFGGPLNVFIDAAPVVSTLGNATGNGPAGGAAGGTLTDQAQAGFGTGLVTFNVDVVSREAEEFLFPTNGTPNPNLVEANVTFFLEDINGHSFTLPSRITLSTTVLVGTGAAGSGGAAANP